MYPIVTNAFNIYYTNYLRIYKSANYKCKYAFSEDDIDWTYQVFQVRDVELDAELDLEADYGFKICFNARDFQPGTRVTDNLEDAIHNSRRVIFIVSR